MNTITITDPKGDKTKNVPVDAPSASPKRSAGKNQAEATAPPRIKRLAPPAKAVSIEEWREAVRQNFPHFLFAAEAALSVMTQILIKDVTNPFALVLVDVPSSGKTITINFFDGLDGLTYASDKFTPASFVSNSVNVRREDLPNIDLLPRLRYKMFLVRDFATIFSKRDDDLNECLGILTRVLDGEGLKTDTGIHGERACIGEYLFMMLAATTPIPPRVWRMMGSLGSRLFFLNMSSPDKGEEELADQLVAPPAKEKERECRAATGMFLQGLWSLHKDGIDWNRAGDPRECLTAIARCADLLARLRGVMGVSKEKRGEGNGVEVEYQPEIVEKPDRINQLFYNFCRGHAVACGRSQIDQEDLRLVAALSLDSAPPKRAKIMRLLIVNGGKVHTPDVERLLGCSKTAALSEMKAMCSLGICTLTDDLKGVAGQPGKVLGLAEKYRWLSSAEYVGLFDRGPSAVDSEVKIR